MGHVVTRQVIQFVESDDGDTKPIAVVAEKKSYGSSSGALQGARAMVLHAVDEIVALGDPRRGHARQYVTMTRSGVPTAIVEVGKRGAGVYVADRLHAENMASYVLDEAWMRRSLW